VDIVINVDEGRAGKIKQIYFCGGFTQEETDGLTDMIATKRYELFSSWITGEGIYHEEAIQQDEFTILNYLQNNGYADATVSIEVCEAKEANRIIIYINADKGPLYKVGCITIKGNTLFTEEEIRNRFIFTTGSIYSPELLRRTVERVTDLYGRYGYIDALVNYEPRLSDEGCVYDLEFSIEEGDQYRVGLIKVIGNCTTQSRVILNETLLVPGEIFNIEKLKVTEERLANIGFFKNINVYAVKSEGPCGLGENYRDVLIEVEETSTGHFGAFIGFSTTEDLFGGFNITETNFNYRGIPDVGTEGFSALRGGGEYAHFTTTIGEKSRSYVLSWSKPHFKDTPWTVGFDLERSSTRFVSKDYDIEASGINTHGSYRLNEFVSLGIHYRWRYTHVDIEESDPSYQLRKEAHIQGHISAIGATLTYDSTNNPVQPTEGFKSRFEFECAGIGGDHDFLTFSYVNSYYFQLPKLDRKGIWKARADACFIQPYGHTRPDTIPIDERYFLGGEYVIRGFRPYKLGPKFPEGDPRGGVSLQFLSLQYTRLVFSRLELFAFVDAGHLSLKKWNFGRLYTSIGYGANVALLDSMPPITVGMGYPLNAKSRGDVKRFFLAIGGHF
jgi:outer membrane protein insertion porin family